MYAQEFSGLTPPIIASTKSSTIPVFLNVSPPSQTPLLIFFTLTLAYNIFNQKLAIEKITRMQGRNIKSFRAIQMMPNSIIRDSKKNFGVCSRIFIVFPFCS